jgi:hypothetical protein
MAHVGLASSTVSELPCLRGHPRLDALGDIGRHRREVAIVLRKAWPCFAAEWPHGLWRCTALAVVFTPPASPEEGISSALSGACRGTEGHSSTLRAPWLQGHRTCKYSLQNTVADHPQRHTGETAPLHIHPASEPPRCAPPPPANIMIRTV